MAKKIRLDNDAVAAPEYRPQRSDDQDVEGHTRLARKPEEIAQGNDRFANTPTDDDQDVEGHYVRLRKPGDEQVKDIRAL